MKLEARNVRTFPDVTLPVIPLLLSFSLSDHENQTSPINTSFPASAKSIQSIASIQSIPPD